MTVEHVVGDLFDQDTDAIGHGVNCVGRMGSGIAVQFKLRFPEMYAEYVRLCTTGELRLGGAFCWSDSASRTTVFNLATQYRIGRSARLEAVRGSLETAVELAEQRRIASIALPRIGAGIGGLRWDDVRSVIHDVADSSAVRIVVVSLPGALG